MNILPPRTDYQEGSHAVVKDEVLMPILRDAGLVQGFDGIIPAAVYGKEPSRRDEGSIGIVYGGYDSFVAEIEKTITSPKPYFNPHGPTRTKGMSLAKKSSGRGDTFSKSSYLLQREGINHLVVEGNEMPWFGEETARELVTAYDLAAITIARTVTVSTVGTELSELSPLSLLPGLLRETAQNILPIFKGHAQRVEALEKAMQMLAKGQAPKY